MRADQESHRLDGFDPDEALDELRSLRREITAGDGQQGDWNIAAAGERMAELFDLLDHWLIVGNEAPAEWARPEPQLVAEYRMQRRRTTTRAQRRG